MTAPLRHPIAAPDVDLADFVECCAYQRWYVDEGWITAQIAADNAQLLAESAGYLEAVGQDEIQRLMSEAFAPADIEPPPLAPVMPAERPRTYCTPAATVEAFMFLARLGDVDRLTAWLNDHPRDAETLRKIWKRKCTAQAQ